MSLQNEIKIIENILLEIQPMVVGHGGEIHFVKYEKNIVYIRLSGTCTSCALSSYTVKYGIEEKVKLALPSVTCVEIV